MNRIALLGCIVWCLVSCGAVQPDSIDEPDPLGYGAQDLKSCAKILPRCTAANCPGIAPFTDPADIGKDLVHRFLPGTHKNPPNPYCPATVEEHYSRCTNDNFRSPPGGNDIAASTADYQYLWYGGIVIPAEFGYVEIGDDSLSHVMNVSQWANVTSIDSIEVKVAVSTADTQGFTLEYESPAFSTSTTVSTATGNWPNGVMLNWLLTTNPATGVAWTKATLQDWRGWLIENANDIDANHIGMFIQSITEVVNYKINGTVCP